MNKNIEVNHMGFPASKKLVLQDRRFARHHAEVERMTRKFARGIFDNFLGLFAMPQRIQSRIRAYRQSLSKHYGIGGIYLPHQSEREIMRRRRQIARGQLTEANGLVRGMTLQNGRITALT